jgi:hypothetical protein
MENRINKKIEIFFSNFKTAVQKQILDMGFTETDKTNDLIEFIFAYDRLVFSKEDFLRRKRLKNTIPNTNRCTAKRANGEQCTRRRKCDTSFCGTHFKTTPHGSFEENTSENTTTDVSIFVQDIKGIMYYLDDNNNIYHTSDILQNKDNPRIIAKYYVKNGEYGIVNCEKLI